MYNAENYRAQRRTNVNVELDLLLRAGNLISSEVCLRKSVKRHFWHWSMPPRRWRRWSWWWGEEEGDGKGGTLRSGKSQILFGCEFTQTREEVLFAPDFTKKMPTLSDAHIWSFYFPIIDRLICLFNFSFLVFSSLSIDRLLSLFNLSLLVFSFPSTHLLLRSISIYYNYYYYYFKWAIPGLFFVYFWSFNKQYNFYNKSMWKNVMSI